jgi:hypothetical protein
MLVRVNGNGLMKFAAGLLTMANAANDPVARLAKYWFRAAMMHNAMHQILRDHNGDLKAIHKKGHWWEFEAFLVYWLSGLFVVVEGFNKLKLKDARVQTLFKAHLRYLKAMRHETYHFSLVDAPDATEIFRKMNWAEELHQAVGGHVQEYLNKKALEEASQQQVKRSRKKKT